MQKCQIATFYLANLYLPWFQLFICKPDIKGLFPEFPGGLGPQGCVWSTSGMKAGCTILRSPTLCCYAPSPNSNFLFSKPDITGLFPEFPGGSRAPRMHLTEKFLMPKWKRGWANLCFYEQVPILTFKFWPPPLGRTPGAPGVHPMTRRHSTRIDPCPK